MKLLVLVSLILGFACINDATAQSDWRSHVPEASRTRPNPLLADLDAPQAGAKLYRHTCASCHGADADGRGGRPSLHTPRVQSATDGELEWLLKNGSLAHGMPAWSRLPEVERWQIVRFMRSMPLSPSEGAAR